MTPHAASFLHSWLALSTRSVRWRTRFGPIEVIEFPTVLLDAASLEVVDEFRVYVRPVRNPTLTRFCTSLTGIEQVCGRRRVACRFTSESPFCCQRV